MSAAREVGACTQYKERLISLEQKFGGIVKDVRRTRLSENEHMSRVHNGVVLHQGGDRMSGFHNYASGYARVLGGFAPMRPLKLIEIGILTGIGLAVWCDILPPGSEVHGLDIDTSIFEANIEGLRGKGAFTRQSPTVHQYDQYHPDDELLKTIGKPDIVIDDGAHNAKAVLTTLRAFQRLRLLPCYYIIEDVPNVARLLQAQYPRAEVTVYDRLMTVIKFHG